ncbi:MAG TPA: cyclic nucleotide-binding domain-containing protein [Roseiflexaceae bacterium]|nr:cyclic nucleotide-binding domain-containing protein [Roseiflexaceae bacterium]
MGSMELFGTAEEQAFAAGSVIFRQGDPGAVMYVVLEGQVDVYREGRLLATLSPGEVLGELALLGQSARTATAVARSACTLAPLDRRRFALTVQRQPYFALDVLRALAERLRAA